MEQKQVPDTWERGDPYERYVGRWSRQVAPKFLDWLDIPAGQIWLDVGCGTGALSSAILEQCAPAWVIGVEPSDGFRRAAQARLGGRAELHPGSAANIPLNSAAVDVVVSGLMLNFVGDPRAALREMARVACAGGVIAAYVWDYADRMEMMRYFWDAAAAVDPGAAALDEGERFPLCSPHQLTELFRGAGLESVETAPVDIATIFPDFDDYWQPFLGGQGSAPSYLQTLDEPTRQRLREDLLRRVPTRPDGSIALVARAWAVRGKTSRKL